MGITGLVRSVDDPTASERLKHRPGRGISDNWPALGRAWPVLNGRSRCKPLSPLIKNDGGLARSRRMGMASRSLGLCSFLPFGSAGAK